MNKSTAMQQGLIYTGHTRRIWECDEIKAKAKEIRKEYKCRAVVVENDGCISVYADKRYGLATTITCNTQVISHIQLRKDKAKEAYETALQEIVEDEARCMNRVLDANAELKAFQ